jgi:next-to-BRCA1 protein 1
MNPSFFFVRGGESEHDGGGCGSSSSFAGKPVCFCGELARECGGGSKLDARLVQDVTIFDGTELAPGASFTKIWRLRNSGSLPWPKECRLVYVGGDEELGGSVDDETSLLLELPEQGLAPQEEVNVSVDLIAPMQPGRYVSYWRLVAPSAPPSEGQRFGHRLWVLIHVTPKDEESPQVAESLVEAQEILRAQDSKQQSVVEEETTSQEIFSSVRAETTVGEDPVDEAQQQQQQQQIEGEKKIVYPEVFKEETAAAAPTTGTVVERQAAAAVGNDADDDHRLAKDKEEAAGVVLASELGSFSMIEIPQETEMLATLEGMGFKDKNWNLELLKMNKNDMQTTRDALVAAAEWDPKLEELEEMGFSDKQLNRKLMLKNKGSLKHVVKELVQMYKPPAAAVAMGLEAAKIV